MALAMNRMYAEGELTREEWVQKTDDDYETFPRFSPRKQFNRLRWVDTPEYHVKIKNLFLLKCKVEKHDFLCIIY